MHPRYRLLVPLIALACRRSTSGDAQLPADAGTPPADTAPAADDGSKHLFPFGSAQFPIPEVWPTPKTACTSEAKATAAGSDRWCAINHDGGVWVLNASALGRGVAVRCAGQDPGCLRLAQSRGQADGFYGETLIYSDSRGYFAWRPGWSAGRLLAGPDARSCDARGNGVVCNVSTDSDVDAGTSRFSAGLVLDQSGPGLPLVDGLSGTVIHRFDPTGRYVLADRRPLIGLKGAIPFELRLVDLGNGAAMTAVDDSVHAYALSGERFYFIKGPTGPGPFGVGQLVAGKLSNPAQREDLVANAFGVVAVLRADGSERGVLAGVVTGAPNTLQYYEPSGDALAMVRQLQGASAPAEEDVSIALDRMLVPMSAGYALTKIDLSEPPCMLSTQRSSRGGEPAFAESAGQVIWGEGPSDDPSPDHVQGFAAPIADCTARKPLGNVFEWTPVADGLLSLVPSQLSYIRFANPDAPKPFPFFTTSDFDYAYEPASKILLYSDGGGSGSGYVPLAEF
jgi:hypothetical protein